MKERTESTVNDPFEGSAWFDPLEEQVRQGIRNLIKELLNDELEMALGGRERYGRHCKTLGYRHGHRERTITGTFGKTVVGVPRARLVDEMGKEHEWRNTTIPAYKKLTKRAEMLIASTYLAGVNTRRVRRALAGLFGGRISKDTVSRAWRKIQSDWATWSKRDLSGEDIIRLILDGTVVKVRLDRQATTICLLVIMGVRTDGQKVLLSVRPMGGETEAAWRQVLDDLVSRGLRTPELIVMDGGKGLEAALAGLWSEVPVQRCTVHKERNLLAHAPKKMHEEIKQDFTDMIYAESVEKVLAKRKVFLAKWRLKCRAVADSLEEAGERLFTFLHYPPDQWKSLRTTNAIERLHEEFKRRIKTQCVLPSSETAAMLFWALLAVGQINLRKVDGWKTLDQKPTQEPWLAMAA